MPIVVPIPDPPARPTGRGGRAVPPATRVGDLAAAARAVRAVPGGVRLTFAHAPGVLLTFDRAVARARLEGTCLRFAIDAPRGGPVTLTITGPPGVTGTDAR